MARRPPQQSGFNFSFPPLTKSAKIALIVNGVIWLILIALFYVKEDVAAEIYTLGRLDPSKVLDGHIYQLATYMFLHDLAEPFHLLFNMLGIYFFTPMLEKRWGVKKLVGFMFAGGLVGGVMVMIFHLVGTGLGTAGQFPTVGFSGAAMAVLSAFCLLRPNSTILFFVFPIKAKWLLAGIVAIDFLRWISLAQGVSFAAHLGGVIFGALMVTDGWKPQWLLTRFRYWRIKRQVDKRKGPGDKDGNVIDGPWLH